MSEQARPPGPMRQRRDNVAPDPQTVRPVERMPLNDPAVTTLPDAVLLDEPRDDADPTSALLARSLAGRRHSNWLWRILTAGLGIGFVALLGWLVQSAIHSIGDGSALGVVAAMAFGLIAVGLAGLIIGEIVALMRLKNRGALRGMVDGAIADGGAEALQRAIDELQETHAARPALAWALSRYKEQAEEVPDASDRLLLYERIVLGPLDEASVQAVSRFARRSAVLTAMSPNPVLDAILVLWLSLAVVRSVARVQGLRPGLLASGALIRRTATAIVAAGAMEALHDIGPHAVAGGVLRKAAGRLGEGAINGVLTVRVGLAALEATRPMPFRSRARPSANQVIGQALGL
jgi:putative membrane protein